MNPSPKQRARFFYLLGELVEERLSTHEAQSLEQLMWDFPGLRDEYADYKLMVSNLHWSCALAHQPPVEAAFSAELLPASAQVTCLQTETTLPDEASAPESTAPELPPQSATSPAARRGLGWQGWETTRWGRALRRPSAVSLLVAALLVASAVVLLDQIPARFGGGSFAEYVTAKPVFVAHLSRAVDCQWADGGLAKFEGAHLVEGQMLDLQRGLAEITFRKGATVILEGPAVFRLESDSAAELTTGQLAVSVPAQAKGFRISTPVVTIVDLGTQFGIRAQATDVEVHVFSGAVVANWSDPVREETSATRRIEAGASVRFDCVQYQVALRAAHPASFVRTLPQRRAQEGASEPRDPGQLIAYEGFHYASNDALFTNSSGAGWAAPWHGGQEGFEMREQVLAYRDAAGRRLASSGNSFQGNDGDFVLERALDLESTSAAARAGWIDATTGRLGADGTTVWCGLLGRGYSTEEGGLNPSALVALFDEDDERLSFGKFGHSGDWHVPGYGSLGVKFSECVFLAARIDFQPGEERVRVWINPPLDGEQIERVAPQADYRYQDFRFSRVRIVGNRAWDIDELRIGQTFSSVAPAAR